MTKYTLTLDTPIQNPPGGETLTFTLSDNIEYIETIIFTPACTDGFSNEPNITFTIRFENNKLNICPTNIFFSKVFNVNDKLCNKTGYPINIFSSSIGKILLKLQPDMCVNVSIEVNAKLAEQFIKSSLELSNNHIFLKQIIFV